MLPAIRVVVRTGRGHIEQVQIGPAVPGQYRVGQIAGTHSSACQP